MKVITDVCVVGAILICGIAAQEAPKPALREGISVQMAVANHAIEMRAADEQNATVVAITADGRPFVGIKPTDAGALSSMAAETVYVKADSRAPFQKVLAVLDALRGKSVVLLTEPPTRMAKGNMVPPYGIKLTVSQ